MKNTLQARLITLMVLSSVFLIAAFTAIQLANQLKRSAESNLYRANMGAILTRAKLEKLFSELDKEASPSFVQDKIRDIFLSELQSRIIDNAVLLDKKAKPIISEGKSKSAFKYNDKLLGEIYKAKTREKWLVPFIDKKSRTIYLFVTTENIYGYFTQLTFSLGSMKEAARDVYSPVMYMAAIVIIATIILAVLLSRVVISPIKLLNQATKDIAGGNLDKKVSIRTEDELEELAGTFNYMTVELKRMKAKAENANPLTKFPGNIVIREEAERRINNKENFILIYCDLDNFKAFNDRYGVQAGDDVIMCTAKIIEEAVRKNGTDKDFIGHEGGDDFLLLTSPEKAESITDYIIKKFDTDISKFYSKDDIKRGYIEGASRDSDAKVKYPIMTISLVGVGNLARKITSYPQITNIAAELKKASKKFKKSNFLVDRRAENMGIEHRKDEIGKDVERRSPIKDRRNPTSERKKQDE